jgi:formylglycine-generating enzyme required for sulfatase activity
MSKIGLFMSFGWIPIPAGQVTLKGWHHPMVVHDPRPWIKRMALMKDYIAVDEHRTFDVPAFSISKYPVTNANYAEFIRANGYNDRRWWTSAGWEECKKSKWTAPHNLGIRSAKLQGSQQPVVGVSWYETIAYCQWLSHETGKSILLPTDQQWQRAAQGDDNRTYPWGMDWDGHRCNNLVDERYGIGYTTTIYHFKGAGDSYFGVSDMAGNIGEWCLTDYEHGQTDLNGVDARIIRNGSFADDLIDNFRCDYRTFSVPESANDFVGFRLACTE